MRFGPKLYEACFVVIGLARMSQTLLLRLFADFSGISCLPRGGDNCVFGPPSEMDPSSEPMGASSPRTSPVIKCTDTGVSATEYPTGVVVVVVAAAVATVLEER